MALTKQGKRRGLPCGCRALHKAEEAEGSRGTHGSTQGGRGATWTCRIHVATMTVARRQAKGTNSHQAWRQSCGNKNGTQLPPRQIDGSRPVRTSLHAKPVSGPEPGCDWSQLPGEVCRVTRACPTGTETPLLRGWHAGEGELPQLPLPEAQSVVVAHPSWGGEAWPRSTAPTGRPRSLPSI